VFFFIRATAAHPFGRLGNLEFPQATNPVCRQPLAVDPTVD